MKTIAITAHKYDILLQRTFWALVGMILLTIACYTVLVNKTVLNVASREKEQSQLSQVRSQIAELETQQIALKEGIDEKKAAELGFIEIADPQYLSVADTNIGRVSYNR